METGLPKNKKKLHTFPSSNNHFRKETKEGNKLIGLVQLKGLNHKKDALLAVNLYHPFKILRSHLIRGMSILLGK
jgi:hypothetical protein